MENTRELIASNITKYRKMCGLTQADLATKLNYSDKAVSKWERGESLPDIIILKEMSRLFGVSLDALTSNEEEKPKKFHKFYMRVLTDKFLISAISTLLVWLVASIVFFVLKMTLANTPKLWMTFIFAIPVNCIVLLCLYKHWHSGWYNFACSSMLVLSIALSFFLMFGKQYLWLLFIICVPIIAILFLWFVARDKIFKRFKDKKQQ